jgi:uncharacterized membrane protein
MEGTAQLVTMLGLFVGTHFLMSHPLRARMVGALGQIGFQAVYSIISLGTFIPAVNAFQSAPYAMPLWIAGDLLWWIATVLMLIGSILLAGSFFGNPALPQPNAATLAAKPARGVFAITRHPMMWGFAIWALVHFLVSPQPKVIILCVAIAFLALVGSAGQDRKKAQLMGDGWKDWTARTSFVPFSLQAGGKLPWSTAWPGRTVVLLGTLIWLAASYGHGWFGIPDAGLWRWL